VSHPRVISISAPDCADQYNGSAEVVINSVQSFLYRAHEGRAVEKRKDDVEIIEVTVHKVSHKVHVRVLKVYGRGFEYGGHPLDGGLVMDYSRTMTGLTSGVVQNSFLRSGMSRAPVFLRFSLNA
jgi:hypothetical protein